MVTVERLSNSERDSWNEYVHESADATPFHRFETLETMGKRTGTEMIPFVGYKGQEPTGLFPVFVKEIAGIAVIYSPPPNINVNYLGPALLNVETLRQRKRSTRNRRFVDATLEYLEDEISPHFVSLMTSPGYEDVRPFSWGEFSLHPHHTFEVDLRPEPDEMLQSFSRDARSNIQSNEDEAVEIREGGVDDLQRTLAQVEEVFRDQGLSYPGQQSFVVDLFRRLDDGTCRTYVCTIDGEFAGGAVTVETDKTLYRWHAATDLSHSQPVYEWLDWHIMTAARERGIERFDMMGADKQSISEYKAKFNPRLRNHYALKRGSLAVTAASKWYQAAKAARRSIR